MLKLICRHSLSVTKNFFCNREVLLTNLFSVTEHNQNKLECFIFYCFFIRRFRQREFVPAKYLVACLAWLDNGKPA
jgi:hypothetical protein